MNLVEFFSSHLSKNAFVLNDADAAGLAEYNFGNIQNKSGTTILLTLGTGIGSALFYNGQLIPNTELGHLKFKKGIAEQYASNKARVENKLSYSKFGKRLNLLLNHIEFLFSPTNIILGGGVSKNLERYQRFLDTRCNVYAATHLNKAGIIGAAYNAYTQ
jgi:polyphosphate glucokinase